MTKQKTKTKYLPVSHLRVPNAFWDIVLELRLKDENAGLMHLKSNCQCRSLQAIGLTRTGTIVVVGDSCSYLETLLLHPDMFKPAYIVSLNTYEYMNDIERRLYLVQLSQVADWARCPVYLAYTNPRLLKTGKGGCIVPERFFKYCEQLIESDKSRLRVLKLSNHKEI